MSYVYVFDFGDMVKVGYTTDLKKRLISIQWQVKRKAQDVFFVSAGKNIEQEALRSLAPYQIHGEYFSCPFQTACDVVSSLVPGSTTRLEDVQSPTTNFTLRIYKGSLAKLDYIAEANDRSRNSEINQAIKQYIARYEKENGKITPEDLGQIE